jgi:hypothetical protein
MANNVGYRINLMDHLIAAITDPCTSSYINPLHDLLTQRR